MESIISRLRGSNLLSIFSTSSLFLRNSASSATFAFLQSPHFSSGIFRRNTGLEPTWLRKWSSEFVSWLLGNFNRLLIRSKSLESWVHWEDSFNNCAWPGVRGWDATIVVEKFRNHEIETIDPPKLLEVLFLLPQAFGHQVFLAVYAYIFPKLWYITFRQTPEIGTLRLLSLRRLKDPCS